MVTKCDDIIERFKEISRQIWGEKIDKIEFTCEERIPKEGLAALSRSCKQVMTLDCELYAYCRNYGLVISPKFSELPKEKQDAILKHESLHIGIDGHGKEFKKCAQRHGIILSQRSLDKGIGVFTIQVKSNGRFKDISDFTDINEARNFGWKYENEHPNEKVRIVM